MNCPCCSMSLKAEDGPHVVCLQGHRFYVEINREDQRQALELVADPLGTAKVALGKIYYRVPAKA